MFNDTWTLSYDPENDASSISAAFTKFDQTSTLSIYTGPNHTFLQRETLSFQRTLPRKEGDFLGFKRSSIKTTVDVDCVNDAGEVSKVPVIITTKAAVPVGAVDAQALAALQLHRGVVADDAIFLKSAQELSI
jgi:hypothetical protein